MKKGKIIALALAAGITFMGAGYAAWTDNVTIQTTVATGTLDYTFADAENVTLYSDHGMTKQDTTVAHAAVSYETDGEGEATDKAIVTITNAYPDAAAKVELTLTNTSSIPTKLTTIQEQVDELLTLQNLKATYNGTEIEYDDTEIPVGGEVKVTFEILVKDGVAENQEGENAYKLILTPQFKQFNH